MELPQLLDDDTIHERDLSEEAKNRFDYHTQIVCRFKINRANILLDVDLTRMARHKLLSGIDRQHKICKQVLNDVAENHEILCGSSPVDRPLVTCGLTRTGTTLLYNLLACDPDCRAPLLTDMYVDSVPPVARSNF